MGLNLERIGKLMGEQVFDREAVAAEFGVSVPYIDKERRAGRLKAIYLGDKPLFTESAIRALFKKTE